MNANMKKIVLLAFAACVAVSATAQNKFAHVNFSELIQLCPEADEARTTMAAASQEAQDTYQAMVDEFQTKYQDYEAKAATWSDSIRSSKEKELTDIQTRIQEFSQSVDLELQQQQQSLMAPIYEKARNVVSQLAKLWKINLPHLRELAQEAWRAAEGMTVVYEWIPRERNKRADKLSNEAIDNAVRGARYLSQP